MIGGNSNFIETTALLSAVGVKAEAESVQPETAVESSENLNIRKTITERLQIKSRFKRLKKRCKSRSSSIL